MIGFVLMIRIYGLVIVCFAVCIPELFPTQVRLRASGICNICGRGATHRYPFLVHCAFPSLWSGRRNQHAGRTISHRNHSGTNLWDGTSKSAFRRNHLYLTLGMLPVACFPLALGEEPSSSSAFFSSPLIPNKRRPGTSTMVIPCSTAG